MTKIKIKLSKQEYDALSPIVTHAAANISVVDAFSLYEKEVAEDIQRRFEARKWRMQSTYTFNLSIVETVVFIKHVGNAMKMAGNYECALYYNIYEQQIAVQTNRAVQMRMRF